MPTSAATAELTSFAKILDLANVICFTSVMTYLAQRCDSAPGKAKPNNSFVGKSVTTRAIWLAPI